jgi:hypothetical protein
MITQYPLITIQYIKQNNFQNSELLAQCNTLAQQAQHFNPTTHCIANTIQLSAELFIANKKVSSDFTSHIRTGFATPILWDYYQDKFKWSINCIQSIDWMSHGTALNQLHHRQKKTIIQFNYRWLPINTSHSLQSTGTARLCPYCSHVDETHYHYLSCPHLASKQIWHYNSQLIQDTIQRYSKHINQTLVKLIILALTEWRTTRNPTRPTFVTPQFYDLFDQQSTIGWDQIINGRFSAMWNTTQLSLSTKVPATWISYISRTIWYHIYEIWKYRCTTNVGNTPQDKRQREVIQLTPKLRSLYKQIEKVSPSDIEVIFNYTLDELLLLPTHTIEQWIYKAEIRIKSSTRRHQQQQKSTNQPIKKFFQQVITATIPTRSTQHRHISLHPHESTPANNSISHTISTFISTNFLSHIFKNIHIHQRVAY